jgi:hypothetical protein
VIEPPSRPTVVGTYRIEYEADLARAVLEAHGIPAVILRDNAGGMLPALQTLFVIRLVVAAEDADAAREVLDSPVEESEDE